MTQELRKDDYEYKPREIVPMPDRPFVMGEGKISGYLAVSLGILSFLAVLCYRYPDIFTTPEFRAAYDAVFLQEVLKYGMFMSLGFALLTFCLGKRRRLGAMGVLLVVAAFALGGYTIDATQPVAPTTLSFGLDRLILAFVVSAMLFIFLEKVFPKYKEQVILRPAQKIGHLAVLVICW